ncbi:hypothetical protein XH89_02570 [Bradyrhizobium sp. CCBAU 53340]|nr:hypothetical protein XH89_02570 [Bradyrhizobium sp. CCBAU 53340]
MRWRIAARVPQHQNPDGIDRCWNCIDAGPNGIYRTDAVRSREGRCGPAAWLGGPSTVQTATATRAEVRMVQATSCFRIRPNPSVEGSMRSGRANHRAPQKVAAL